MLELQRLRESETDIILHKGRTQLVATTALVRLYVRIYLQQRVHNYSYYWARKQSQHSYAIYHTRAHATLQARLHGVDIGHKPLCPISTSYSLHTKNGVLY